MQHNDNTINTTAHVNVNKDNKDLSQGAKIAMPVATTIGTGLAFTIDTSIDAAKGIKGFIQRKAAEIKEKRAKAKAEQELKDKLYAEYMAGEPYSGQRDADGTVPPAYRPKA
jgi:CRISPR/Cas system-associated protein Csx1